MTTRHRLHSLLLALALIGTGARAADLDACADAAKPLSSLIGEPLLIFGELHGTAQTPALVGSHVCALLRAGKNVLLALEIPDDEQQRIDTFMASAGSPADVQQLLAGKHWQRDADQQDGRSSQAMLRLIELARRQAGMSNSVHVLAFDHWEGDLSRDTMMARNIEAARRRFPGYSTVGLAGNLHAMTTRSTPFDPDHQPMAYQLKAQKPVTIDVVPTSGQSWFCAPVCGVHDLARRRAPMAGANLRLEARPTSGFDATLFLADATASSPAAANTDDSAASQGAKR